MTSRAQPLHTYIGDTHSPVGLPSDLTLLSSLTRHVFRWHGIVYKQPNLAAVRNQAEFGIDRGSIPRIPRQLATPRRIPQAIAPVEPNRPEQTRTGLMFCRCVGPKRIEECHGTNGAIVRPQCPAPTHFSIPARPNVVRLNRWKATHCRFWELHTTSQQHSEPPHWPQILPATPGVLLEHPPSHGRGAPDRHDVLFLIAAWPVQVVTVHLYGWQEAAGGTQRMRTCVQFPLAGSRRYKPARSRECVSSSYVVGIKLTRLPILSVTPSYHRLVTRFDLHDIRQPNVDLSSTFHLPLLNPARPYLHF